MNGRLAGILTVTGVLCLAPSVALSRMYKCVDNDGQVTYSQLPCATEQENRDLRISNVSSVNEKVCTEVSQFVGKVVNAMRHEREASDVIDEYGGIDGISKGAFSIINYVYSFKSSKQISTDRIANLSVTKCKNNAFGNLTYDDVPGAIDPDSEEALRLKLLQEQQATMGAATTAQEQESESPVISNRGDQSIQQDVRQSAVTGESQDQRLCNSYTRELENIDSQMRSGYGSAEGERLRESRRDLKEKIRTTCR